MDLRMTKTTLTEKRINWEEISLSDFKVYYISFSIQTMQIAEIYIHRLLEQNRKFVKGSIQN